MSWRYVGGMTCFSIRTNEIAAGMNQINTAASWVFEISQENWQNMAVQAVSRFHISKGASSLS
ncbi:MAG: hypothetical protein LBB80_05505 [Treponema sp.]|nr:hypothetical protein [Treponema sp.]